MHHYVPYNFVYDTQNCFTPDGFSKQPWGRKFRTRAKRIIEIRVNSFMCLNATASRRVMRSDAGEQIFSGRRLAKTAGIRPR